MVSCFENCSVSTQKDTMTTVLETYREFISSGDPMLREFFFLRSIKPMVTFVSIYVLFVTYLGPAIMKNRKAIEMRRIIIAYNFALVLYYLYFLTLGLYFVYTLGLPAIFCGTLNSSESPTIAQIYLHGYQMYFVRYIEFTDTVFLVLSKKFHMITPMHVFHHAIVPIFGYFGFRSERSSYLSLFMGINSTVHIIMYTYYAIAALGHQYQKYLWWKKYLTSLQILQFLFMTLYLLVMSAFGCTSSRFTFVFCIILTILFFFLFINYYQRTFNGTEKKDVYKNGVHHPQLKNSAKNK